MKISAVCPVCHVTLSWEDTQTELWGHIDALDVGCVSVTRGYDPLVEEHLNAHRLDGSFMAALSKHYERLRTNAEGFLARFPAPPDVQSSQVKTG